MGWLWTILILVHCGTRSWVPMFIAMMLLRKHSRPMTLGTQSTGWISTASGETMRCREGRNCLDRKSTLRGRMDRNSRNWWGTKCARVAHVSFFLSESGRIRRWKSIDNKRSQVSWTDRLPLQRSLCISWLWGLNLGDCAPEWMCWTCYIAFALFICRSQTDQFKLCQIWWGSTRQSAIAIKCRPHNEPSLRSVSQLIKNHYLLISAATKIRRL